MKMFYLILPISSLMSIMQTILIWLPFFLSFICKYSKQSKKGSLIKRKDSKEGSEGEGAEEGRSTRIS